MLRAPLSERFTLFEKGCRAPVTQGSLANFLSPVRRVGLFSACVPPVPGARSGSKEVCARHEVGMSFACADGGGGPTETEVRAHEGAHRGRPPRVRSPSRPSTKP